MRYRLGAEINLRGVFWMQMIEAQTNKYCAKTDLELNPSHVAFSKLMNPSISLFKKEVFIPISKD